MLVRRMKRILVLLSLLACTSLVAEDLSEKYAPLGQVIYTPFETAPFPHPLRADGHKYQNRFFSAAEHYSDNHVLLFIPKGFHAGSKVDFVVHFHGWGNAITNGSRYKLIEQFAASRRNAILVFPEGPVNASDSFGGKLEDVGGFHRFMDEAMAKLKERQILKDQAIGKIILSGHSGGYEVISSIVAWGGLNENIREVWLFDALYGNTERFVVWFDHHKGRFIDLYTEHGGTKTETQNLMSALKENRVPFFTNNETNATPRDFRANHLVFVFSELPHDEVMQHRNTFQEFLETSSLGKTRK
jgi:hypothetical protein